MSRVWLPEIDWRSLSVLVVLTIPFDATNAFEISGSTFPDGSPKLYVPARLELDYWTSTTSAKLTLSRMHKYREERVSDYPSVEVTWRQGGLGHHDLSWRRFGPHGDLAWMKEPLLWQEPYGELSPPSWIVELTEQLTPARVLVERAKEAATDG